VSGQLNVETYCLAMSKVYTFGPDLPRGELQHSAAPREFWMIEPEIAFADLTADADLAEAFLKYLFRAVLDERGDDLAFFAERIDPSCVSRLESFVESSFERMDYTDAIAALEKAVAGGAASSSRSPGYRPAVEHERYLTEELIGPAGGDHELPEGHQGVLHAGQRRRSHGGRDGRTGAGHRGDHRRLATRGAARPT